MFPRCITDQEVLDLISYKEAVEVTEKAFLNSALGKSRMPNKLYLELPEYKGDFRAMPAYDSEYDVAGIKWVNSHSQNFQNGLPSVSAMMIVNDPRTAQALAVLEATALTALRTGAAGAVAAKYLTVNDELIVACVGCGEQAVYQLRCLKEVRNIDHVKVVDLTIDKARKFADRMCDELGFEFVAVELISECLFGADLVVTTTPSSKPLVMKSDLDEHVLINAMGADAVGKQELDPHIFLEAFVVVDDLDQASHSGEIHQAISSGHISLARVGGVLGDIVAGNVDAQVEGVRVFDSTGLAIQDLALAGFILREKIG